ncbi:hypothetical protein Goshw_008675, partial [Gossypium schwendimanii]|nr:hypothetical protein [Gossypium schwendimanii]
MHERFCEFHWLIVLMMIFWFRRREQTGEFTTHALRPESDRWRPPKQGFFKINPDAAFNVKENKSYSGIIVRNFKGDILASKTMVHDNIPSGFAAEAAACLQAVTVGRDLGMKYVKIEGDSLMVIKKAQNRDKSAIGPYIL